MHINLPWNCRVCAGMVFLFASRMLAKPYHLGVNWPSTLRENKDGVHLFTLNFECHNRYNKLLLCDSENGDIAWCHKIIQNRIFRFPQKKEQNLVSLKKKNVWKQQKNLGGLGSFEKKQVFLNPGFIPMFTCLSMTCSFNCCSELYC